MKGVLEMIKDKKDRINAAKPYINNTFYIDRDYFEFDDTSFEPYINIDNPIYSINQKES